MAPLDPRLAQQGRGAVSNPPGRFASKSAEAADDGWGILEEPLAPLATTIEPDASRNIIARNRSPDIPFAQSINPYQGCEHGCVYCTEGDTPVLMADGSTRPIACGQRHVTKEKSQSWPREDGRKLIAPGCYHRSISARDICGTSLAWRFPRGRRPLRSFAAPTRGGPSRAIVLCGGVPQLRRRPFRCSDRPTDQRSERALNLQSSIPG